MDGESEIMRRLSEPLNGPADEVKRPIQPGDWVFVRVFKRSSLQPQREGPFQVTRATPTEVHIQGSNVWYHLNFCRRAPDPRMADLQGLPSPSPSFNSSGPSLRVHRFVKGGIGGSTGRFMVGMWEEVGINQHTAGEVDWDGAFTKAMIKLRRLRDEVTENAEQNTFESPLVGWFQNAFGFGLCAWAAKILMGIVLAILAISLIICCLVPVLRCLAVRLVASKLPQMPLVLQFDEDCNMSLQASQNLLDSYMDSPVIDPVTIMVPSDVGEGLDNVLLWEQGTDIGGTAPGLPWAQSKGLLA
ncbi:hypothetical protein ACEWY4_025541 [Coilia grayii]|uniref:Murine leukemia virus integrase C-terminal domain-containing protein n=1 Tax=Coilia grayii TaxID=363190 RepID=A0ABD1IY77_9TELE